MVSIWPKYMVSLAQDSVQKVRVSSWKLRNSFDIGLLTSISRLLGKLHWSLMRALKNVQDNTTTDPLRDSGKTNGVTNSSQQSGKAFPNKRWNAESCTHG